jgi:rod shape-determining protein MreC
LRIFYRIRKFPTRVIVFLIILLVILAYQKTFPGLRSVALGILTKPHTMIAGTRDQFRQKSELKSENMRLKQNLAQLSVALARLREIERENERFRDILDIKMKKRLTTIVAEVIARDTVDWRRSLIINKGEQDGIREHMPCATAEGLVGSVAEVGPTSSKVILITDPNSRVGVILDPSREAGILVGSPEGVCRVIYLSLDKEIGRGEEVVTAGFSAFFPKGIVIGRVSQIGVDRTGLSTYAVVDLAEDLNTVEEVICIVTEE